MEFTYLASPDGGLRSDTDDDVDGGRRSDDDDDERTSRPPATPTVHKKRS